MNKNLKAGLIVGAILALLGAYLVYVLNENAKMTAAATGTVTEAEFVRDPESSSLDETRISYAFEANGGAHTGSDALSGADRSGDYPPGTAIPICYDPEDPSSSRIDRGSGCG